MKTATITEAKNGLSALIDRVRAGEQVLITDRGIPVARLEPVTNAVDQSGEFWAHPFFQKHRDEVKILQEGVAKGSFPGTSYGLHANIGLLAESDALPRMLERIVKENVDVEKAVTLAQAQFESD